MTDPDKEVNQSLDRADVQSFGARLPAQMGASMATDPTTVPLMLTGYPELKLVGKVSAPLAKVAMRGVEGAVLGGTQAGVSNATRQLTDKSGEDFSGSELATNVGVGSILGSGLGAVGEGLSALGNRAKDKLAEYVKLIKGADRAAEFHKDNAETVGLVGKISGDKIDAQLADLANPKVTTQKNPLTGVSQEAMDMVGNNPMFKDYSDKAQYELAKQYQSILDEQAGHAAGKINAYKDKMIAEYEKLGVPLKHEDISEVDVANWVKNKKVDLESQRRNLEKDVESEYMDYGKAATKSRTLKEDLENQKKLEGKIGVSDLLKAGSGLVLGHGLAGIPGAIAGGIYGASHPLVQIANALTMKNPGLFLSAGENTARGLSPLALQALNGLKVTPSKTDKAK
jgi:hypothetical protein